MIILSLETSGHDCGLALYSSEMSLSSTYRGLQHKVALREQIEQLLQTARIPLEQISAFAFDQGPGSFTGLRVAASFLQGLSLGLQIPVMGVSSLRAIAWQVYQATACQNVLALRDARMSEFYAGHYILSSGTMRLQGEEYVHKAPELAHEALRVLAEPQALAIANCAYHDLCQGAIGSGEALPVYIREQIIQTANKAS